MKEYLDAQAAKTAIPTPAQAEAGNYRKGRVKAHGLPIVIETARGAMRRGIGHDGKPWAVRSPAHYGYISRTEGADGDHVDVYIGPHLKSKKVYVLDQRHADTGRFDEHKVFLGFVSPRQVLAMYRKAFSDGKADARFGKLMEMSPEQFRDWLAKADTTKPIHRADGGRVNYADGGDIADGVFGTARDYMLETGADRPELFDPYAQETAAYLRDNNGTWGQRARKAASDFGGYLWDAGKNIAGAPVKIASNPSSVAPFVGRLTGTMGYEREQTWPEKMIRSGATLPGDVYAGREQMWDPETNHTADRIIERTQDLAGLAGGSSFAAPAEEASLRSGMSGRLHHGSPQTDITHIVPSERGPLGPGVYTTPTESLARHYAGEDGRVYDLPTEGRDIFRGNGHRTDEEWHGFKNDMRRLVAAAEPQMRQQVESIASKMWSGDGYPLYQRLKSIYGGDEGAQNLFKRAGFDGLSGIVDGHEVLLFGPQHLMSDSGKPGTAVAGLRRSALPMDEASRMARAAEQGYTVDAYKGGQPHDWDTMPVRNGRGEIVPGTENRVPQELTQMKDRAFFSDNPTVANRFAAPYEYGAVWPAKLKFDNPLVIDAKGLHAADFQFESLARERGTIPEMEAFKKALEGGEHDGVILKNTRDEGTVYVPLRGDQVRSRFAAFDPANKGKSGLLLSDSGQPGSAIAAMANADGKITRLPSPQSLQALPHPSLQNMKDFSRVESVPLSDVRTMQDGRGGMNWEANKRGEYAAPLMKDYADKPVAVRKETGEYVIIDGNHRTVNAINRGDRNLEMHVIDAKKYAPHAAGVKPSRSGAKWGKDDDEILRELGAGMTNRARGGAVEHMADGGAPGGDGWVDVPDEKSGDWVDVPKPSPKVGTGKAALEGYLSGASANFRDEVYGASEASGLPPVLGGFRAPVGAARIGLESMWPETFGTSATDAYTKARDETRVIQKAAKEQHPYAYGAGEIGGALMPMVALPGAGPAASATTMSTRALRGAQIGAEYGALAGAGEGESASERITGAGTGALVGGVGGAAAPVAGKAAEIVYDRFGRPIVGAIRGMVNWEAEAARRVTTALQRDAVDIAAGRAKGMLPQDWAAARAAGEPVTIADLGAGNTQALLRSAANTSPEGRAALEKVINDRFAGQSQRVADEVRGLVAGGANAGKTADQLVAEYDVARAPAYRAAFNHPKAQSMWDNEFAQMAQAPAVQEAIRMATINARDEAAKLGLKPPVNPFQFGKDGTVSLTDPNFKPNLQFWDVVKKNLDSGDRLSQQWAKVLRNKLDGYGTGYDRARGIAATFFGERDALAAGRSLAGKKIAPDELEMIMRKMNPQERDLFREGYASDWADRVISNMSDTRDVTKAMFNSPAQRKVAQIVFGPAGMAKIEARMAIESIMDGARRSMGNSTTARQLIEAGLAGGALGGLESGWDPYHMAAGAATAAGARKVIGAEIAAGAQKLVGRVDSNTARRVAELLTSNDPAQLQKGLALAVSNKRIGEGLRSIANRLALSGAFQAPVPHRLTAPFGMTGSAPAAAQGNQE